MATRTLELTLISAKGLKDVNLFSKVEIYAIVSLDGDRKSQQRTHTDREGGINPAWNATLRFPLLADDPSRHTLHILLHAERVLGDRDVGEVHIPLKELISGPGDAKAPQFLSYQVRRPSSGKAKGVLNVSSKISDTVVAPPPTYPPPPPQEKVAAMPAAYPAYPPPSYQNYSSPAKMQDSHSASYPPPQKGSKSDEPPTAYPAVPGGYPPSGSAAPYPYPQGYPAYPPAGPSGYGYPPQQPPPQAGYGYPPAAGYGYAPVQPQQPPRKNNFGLGLGAGLLGGALGGLLIGDMVSDATSYDAGYDAGFDDAGGFDF